MIPNQDEHGIRYTMYSMNDIDSEMLEILLYQEGKNLSDEAAYKEEEARQRAEWEARCEKACVEAQDEERDPPTFDDFEVNLDDFNYVDIDEPIIEGTYQDVHYRTVWLGGAQMLWVFKSPIIGHFNLCSPCAPGACDGGRPTPRADGFLGYAVPPGWLFVDPGEPRNFADWIGEFE